MVARPGASTTTCPLVSFITFRRMIVFRTTSMRLPRIVRPDVRLARQAVAWAAFPPRMFLLLAAMMASRDTCSPIQMIPTTLLKEVFGRLDALQHAYQDDTGHCAVVECEQWVRREGREVPL